MERGNRDEARGDTEMIPVVPFLCKKVHLRWRGVTATKANQRHEGLTLFSGNHRHEGLCYSSNNGDSFAAGISLYRVLGARIHNSIGGSRDELPKFLQQDELGEDLTTNA